MEDSLLLSAHFDTQKADNSEHFSSPGSNNPLKTYIERIRTLIIQRF